MLRQSNQMRAQDSEPACAEWEQHLSRRGRLGALNRVEEAQESLVDVVRAVNGYAVGDIAQKFEARARNGACQHLAVTRESDAIVFGADDQSWNVA